MAPGTTGAPTVLAFKSDLDRWLHDMSVDSLKGTVALRSAPIISELRVSMAKHANLRYETDTLRVAHHESVLQLHTSLERMIEQIRFRQDA